MTITGDQPSASFIAGIQALGSREPGYAAAQECLRIQAESGSVDSQGRPVLASDAWSWYVGALGEIIVGNILRALGPEWLVLHAVPIGSGATDVDHLLVGPAGVFVLNTKRVAHASVWVGDFTVKVNGSSRPYLASARHEASEAVRRLSQKTGFPVEVTSAIVVVGARSLKDIRATDARSTAVIRSGELLSWLAAQPRILSPSHIGLIRLAAEEPQTWHIDPHAADTMRVMARFERLHEEIGDDPASPHSTGRPARTGSSRRVPATRSRASKPARTSTPIAPGKRPRVVRSRAERIFWGVFLTVVGLPVGIILLAMTVGAATGAFSR